MTAPKPVELVATCWGEGNLDIQGAWAALWERRPPPLANEVELRLLRDRSRRWSWFRYSLLPGVVGVFIIGWTIATDTFHRLADPQAAEKSIATHVASADFQYHFWIEIGVAFFIAGLVSLFIESTARREQTRLLEESIRLIGNEVVQGVYRVRHDRSYVQSVVSSCLAVQHVRRDFEVDCVVSEFTEDERREWGIASPTLVKIEAELTYWTENIGNRSGEFEGRYFIPRRPAAGVNRFSRLTYLEVGDRHYSTDTELGQLELTSDHPEHLESDRGYGFKIPARPRVPTKVHLRAEFAKERSDNEIFTFLRPTIGAKIKFRFNLPGLTVGVKARTATPMDRPPEIVSGRMVYWEVAKGALLPNNHVTVWWSTEEAGGAAATHMDLSDLTELESTMDDTSMSEATEPAETETGSGTLGSQTGWQAWYDRARGLFRRKL